MRELYGRIIFSQINSLEPTEIYISVYFVYFLSASKILMKKVGLEIGLHLFIFQACRVSHSLRRRLVDLFSLQARASCMST